MKFNITITCDNAAFSPVFTDEVERILRKLEAKLADNAMPNYEAKLMDYNGNTVGSIELLDDIDLTAPRILNGVIFCLPFLSKQRRTHKIADLNGNTVGNLTLQWYDDDEDEEED